MNLKYIMLSKRCQTQNTKHWMISFIWHTGKDKTIEIKTNQWSPKLSAGQWVDCRGAKGLFWGNGTQYTFIKTCSIVHEKERILLNLKYGLH